MPGPSIAVPDALFGDRRNSQGWDLTDPVDMAQIDAGRASFAAPHQWHAAPLSPAFDGNAAPREVHNPAHPGEVVGTVAEANADLAAAAIGVAEAAQPAWHATGAAARAAILRKVADLYEENTFEILALATREAGKTLLDGVAEIREAVDFLRYYADEAEKVDAVPARGVIACISPWNFPLAIFSGQIAAALAAGNAVVAKPAEQTPLIAHRAVEMMLTAGVPEGVIQLLPGDGVQVGGPLSADPRIAGVCFTGSTEVAKIIDRQLAQSAPDAMLIAETGGMNAMIVDSTALLEQAVRDIVRSSFQSAGQRCSALRILYVQKDVEAHLLEMLQGAMDALVMGDPWNLSTDVGPVIDADARDQIAAYIAQNAAEGRLIKQLDAPKDGLFIPPTLLRSDGITAMTREIFGPVLHVTTFEAKKLDAVIDEINAKGYGLTFGLHTRIDRRVQRVLDRIHVGNAYVNRDQIGAVVGSQPFGGHGLSGTGPKAGGEHYLPRFLKGAGAEAAVVTGKAMPVGEITRAFDSLDAGKWPSATDRLARLQAAMPEASAALAAAATLKTEAEELPGPTGESNQMMLIPRGTVLCLGPDAATLRAQVVQALAAGNAVLAVAPDASQHLMALLGQRDVPLVALDGTCPTEALRSMSVDVVACGGDADQRHALRRALAERDGAILPLIGDTIAPALYCAERTVCIDTTAAGGNAALLAEAGE